MLTVSKWDPFLPQTSWAVELLRGSGHAATDLHRPLEVLVPDPPLVPYPSDGRRGAKRGWSIPLYADLHALLKVADYVQSVAPLGTGIAVIVCHDENGVVVVQPRTNVGT